MDKLPPLHHYVPECETPLEELKKLARVKKIPPALLDYEIVDFFTYMTREGESDSILLQPEEMHKLNEESFLLDPSIHLQQLYSINIFTHQESDDFKLTVSVMGNKSLSRAVALIKQGSHIKKRAGLDDRLYRYLNSKKTRYGLMLGIHDDLFKKEIDHFIELIPESGDINQDYQLVLCRGIEPVMTQNSKLIRHYEKKLYKEDSHGRIDHSERGKAVGIQNNELIAEILKPKAGSPGRDCKGRYVDPGHLESSELPPLQTGEGIRTESTDEHIRYYAETGGYVESSESQLSVKAQMDIEEVSFKNTGSLRAGLDSGMVLRVSSKDSLGDSIGIGIEIEVTEVQTEGNVGSGSTIHARKVTIGGQTHHTSKIESDFASVEIHKGHLKAKEARINRLEGGHIEADSVTIFHAIGGTVLAREIYIENLHSNSKIEASEKIEISVIKGEDNKIAIDPAAYYEQKKRIEHFQEVLRDEEKQVYHLKKEFESPEGNIRQNTHSVHAIKDQITELTEHGEKPPAVLLEKVKEFHQMAEKAEALKQQIAEIRSRSKHLREEVDSYREKSIQAEIIHHSPWRGYNEIRFRLHHPKAELLFVPRNGEKLIFLQRDYEGHLEISYSKVLK